MGAEPITIDRADLRTGLGRVRLDSPGGGVCPVLLEAADGRLHLASEGGEVRVEASVPAEGDLEPVLVPHAVLAPLVERWKPGAVHLSREPEGPLVAEASAGRSTAELFVYDAATFPRRRPLRRNADRVDISGAWGHIQRVAKAADAAGEMKVDWLKDITVTGGYAYATDKYRVHRAAIGAELNLRVPGSIIATAVKAGAEVVALVTDGARFELVSPDTTWVGALASVEAVLKAAPTLAKPFEFTPDVRMTMKRQELVDAVTTALALPALSGVVTLEPDTAGTLTVRRVGKDVGKAGEELDATISGKGIAPVSFIGANLLGSLKAVTAEEVTLEGTKPLAVWRFRDDAMEVGLMPTKP